MSRVAWSRGEGPLVAIADGYHREFVRLGYSSNWVTTQLVLIGQLNRWLADRGLTAGELTPARAEEFFAARRALGQRRVPTQRSLVSLFSYLQAEGVVPPPLPAPRTAIDELLGEYHHHLIHERGVTPLTALRYERMARRFLNQRLLRNQSGSATGVEGLNAADITAYLLECCGRLTVESAKREAADLRALLRFAYLKGLLDTDLGTAMPPVAAWRDTRLPSVLSASTIGALLDSCDRLSPSGLRDLAILSLLARLGLRAGEVAALQLGDIDWRAGELGVRGKGRRYDRLPLPVEVGEALVAYLTQVRPRADCPNVILTLLVPHRAIHPSSITNVVYRACRRAGLPRVGSHRLRHALASEMLRLGGDLIEIGQVLRHRDLGTTTVYAKVDRGALRSVAHPWPGAER
jgi:integrase/recombinase XerD